MSKIYVQACIEIFLPSSQKNAASLMYVAEKDNINMAAHLEELLKKCLNVVTALLFRSISYIFDLKVTLNSGLNKHQQEYIFSSGGWAIEGQCLPLCVHFV